MKSEIPKRCNDCERVLSEDDFYWRNKKKGWRCPYCKKCHGIRAHFYYLNNKNKLRNINKRWRENNQDKMKKLQKKWEQNNKDHRKEYSKQWHQNNKERLMGVRKQWRQDNKDKVNALTAKHRAIKFNQTPKLTEIEQNRINFIYKICSTMADYHVDHIQPLSKGGLHHPDNLQVMQAALNLEKSDKYPLTEEEEIKYKGYKL